MKRGSYLQSVKSSLQKSIGNFQEEWLKEVTLTVVSQAHLSLRLQYLYVSFR